MDSDGHLESKFDCLSITFFAGSEEKSAQTEHEDEYRVVCVVRLYAACLTTAMVLDGGLAWSLQAKQLLWLDL